MIRRVAADGSIETGGAFTPIQRPRVLDRIADASRARIVLIIAPAGYGKSVALRQYLEEAEDAQSVLFAMREEHGTLLGFVRGLSAALASVAPDLQRTVFGAYEKNAGSPTVGIDLAMWMHAHVKGFGGVIALDDLQYAERDPQITTFLVSLIERTKGRVRWIISSRSALDLPVGSWLAYGETELGVDEHDLGFTIEEARQTAKAARVAVRDDELEQIIEMTSGWPTAMIFALRSSTRSVDLRNIANTTREMVYRYLAEQVYQALSPDDRDLLHLVAFLPEIDVNVLRNAGYTRAKAAVEELRDRVSFIYPERPGVYRAHDLFAEFLRHQVEMLGDAAVYEIRMRAAHALEAAGDAAHALRHYSAIGASDDALHVLRTRGVHMMEHALGDAVAEAIAALPRNLQADDPFVIGLRGMLEQHAGRFDRAQNLYERALAGTQDAEFRARLALRIASVLHESEKFSPERLEPFASDPSISRETHALVQSFLALGYASQQRGDEAARAMRQVEELLTLIEDDELHARVMHRLGKTAVMLDMDPRVASEYFTRAHALGAQNGLFLTASSALGGLQTIAVLAEDDLSNGAWLAQQALNAAMKGGVRSSVQLALLQAIHIEMRRGSPERLRALEKQFNSTITSDVERASYIVPARALLLAWDGRFDEALRLVSVFKDPSYYAFDKAYNGAVLALFALGAGERDRALESVAKVVPLLESCETTLLHGARTAEYVRAMCVIVEALALRTTAAQKLLSARPVAAGVQVEAMRAAAQAVIRYAKNSQAREEVLEAFGAVNAVGLAGIALLLERVFEAASQDAGHGETPLTKTERQILEKLADGLTPKEIAQASGRSIFTIRAHIQNAIGKLGCSGQTEALALARKKRLINFH